MESHEPTVSPDSSYRRTAWWAIDELCERQVHGQHAALREGAASLRDRFLSLALAYGSASPELVEVSLTFETIAATLLSHLAKEENILFPAFASLAAAWRSGTSAPPLPFPTVRHPISLMEAEHERLEHTLAHLHRIVSDLTLPSEATEAWQACRTALHDFEHELRSDTALEDEVLFPRALELERALL